MLNLAKIATKNTALLKELNIEEVLQLHPLITPLNFKQANKTKPIRARPISTLISTDSVLSHMVLATLEGHETIRANAFVCWGEGNDTWQQTGAKLHAKYTPVKALDDGWVLFEPKAETPVNCCLIDDTYVLGEAGGFSVINPSWGDERQMDGKQVFLQYGVGGDYVLHGVGDPKDLYIVARKFFQNTYELA